MGQVDIKQFSGFMNTDDANTIIAPSHHKYAKNGRFRGLPNNLEFQGIPGTRLITNNLPTGNNQCIGAFYDDLKQRIYWFNYNSNANHGLYVYYLRTHAIDRVAVVGYNTNGDIFEFSLDAPIYDVKMLYGDSTQGDILYFNNSQREPCQINISRALSGDYGTIERSFIDVAKEPPIMPPSVLYEDDNTVTVNNLRKRLFKFKARNVFGNKEKSVTSSESELPLPVNYTDSNIDKDPTKNCRIAIVIPTGSAEVRKIEILGAISGAQKDGVSGVNQFGDFFLITTLDKDALSIPDNDLYTYRFYNDQAYVTIDLEESNQLFDLVPLGANTVEFLNGNVPIYGGITEGFNRPTLTATATVTGVAERTTQYPFLFLSNQSGDSGFGTGNIHVIVIGAITVGQIFTVYTTNQTITFTATVATTTNVINGLAAAAIVAGFTVVSSNSENLYITKTGESLQRSLATNILIAVGDSFVYDWNSRYSFGVVYFDQKGRTNGVITNTTLPVQTVNYTETGGTPNIPKITLSISSRPPDWAYYYQIVRTKNLSKSKFLYWVSDRTWKDNQYAYIGIENLNTFITENDSSKFLAYSFAPNDRIRFLKVLSGSVNTIYTNQDFEILGQVFNPEINGVVQQGQYVKIALPTTSGTFDFGDDDFFNYYIQLYTPAQSVANGLDIYYEFGERYSIGNPGTVTAFHQGMLQNQTSNLSQPATFELMKGDFYYRRRAINTGGDLNYLITAGERSAGRHTLGVSFDNRTFTDANITTGNSPLNNLSGWTFASSSRAIILMGASSGIYRFRAKGVINVNFDQADTFSYFFQDNTGLEYYAIQPRLIPAGANVLPFDFFFQLNSSQFISVLGWSEGDFSNFHWYSQTELKITIQKVYTVGIIDPNFSDFFESAVNSNGREWAVEPDAAQVYYPNLMRYGLSYEVDTNLNQTNRFYPQNFAEADRSKGDIRRFKARERILRIFQDRGCGQMGIYARFIQDNTGASVLSTTDEIITQNNIQYYQGDFGLGGQPGSLVSASFRDYFVDPVRGYQLRLSGDGIEIINVLYKGQFFIGSLLAKYANSYTRSAGGTAKILGAYNFQEEEYIAVLQGGTNSTLGTISDHSFSFNEKRNSYCSFYDFHPEWILSVGDKIYSWKNGQLYAHDDETNQCRFYGQQYYPSIKLVFNDKVGFRKNFDTISYQSNRTWVSDENGEVNTSEYNEFTSLQQVSQLKSVDYELRGNYRDAAFNRDANSLANAIVAVNEGDFLCGVWIEVNLTYKGSSFAYLFEPYINWDENPKNF